MIALIPTFHSRVAPNFAYSPTAILARIEEGRIKETESLDLSGTTTEERLALLKLRNVSTLVCGGIDCELAEALKAQGVQTIANVAGETHTVLAELSAGRLQEGFGIFRARRPNGSAPSLAAHGANGGYNGGKNKERLDHVAAEHATAPDCLACERRACLTGTPCDHTATIAVAAPPSTGDPFGEILEVTADIAGESERALCRVAELVYFALGMKYRRLGLAFCAEMFPEAEILVKTLRRFFEVVPVCCRLNGAAGPGRRTGLPIGDEFAPSHPVDGTNSAEDHDKINRSSRLSSRSQAADGTHEDGTYMATPPSPDDDPSLPCHPLHMAEALNHSATQLNVMAGLCMGADVVFTQASAAPVTTLFVKDRLLANNPIAALHSSHVLKRILQEA